MLIEFQILSGRLCYVKFSSFLHFHIFFEIKRFILKRKTLLENVACTTQLRMLKQCVDIKY